MATGKIYMNGKYLCDADPTGEIPTITAMPETDAEVDKTVRKLDVNQEYNFTAYVTHIDIPKAWRRWPICKSRKRFVKKLMGCGVSRNMANRLADMARKYCGENPYQIGWLMFMKDGRIDIL